MTFPQRMPIWCPTCGGVGKVYVLGLLGFKIKTCKTCKGVGKI